MTVLEAAYIYGVKEHTTSVNDSIRTLCFQLYQSYDDVYRIVLQRLNQRVDWYALAPNVNIKYLPKSVCSKIYEITG